MSEEKEKEGTGFSWEDLGDIAEGRPNLGNMVPVSVYLVVAGRRAGREYCRNVLDTTLDLPRFLADLQKKLREWNIGILRIEKSDLERQEFILSVAEDLDCSGLPVSDDTVCDFDEGFIAGVFLEYTGREFMAREVDCWASGERVCRFEVAPVG
jgi:predicted hydrocarbon binding protein